MPRCWLSPEIVSRICSRTSTLFTVRVDVKSLQSTCLSFSIFFRCIIQTSSVCIRLTALRITIHYPAGHMVASHFKNMKSPTFRVVQEQDGRAVFFYTPGSKERVGLGPLVIGLIRAVAELQFGITSLSIQQLKTLEDGTIEFSMEWDDDSAFRAPISSCGPLLIVFNLYMFQARTIPKILWSSKSMTSVSLRQHSSGYAIATFSQSCAP